MLILKAFWGDCFVIWVDASIIICLRSLTPMDYYLPIMKMKIRSRLRPASTSILLALAVLASHFLIYRYLLVSNLLPFTCKGNFVHYQGYCSPTYIYSTPYLQLVFWQKTLTFIIYIFWQKTMTLFGNIFCSLSLSLKVVFFSGYTALHEQQDKICYK